MSATQSGQARSYVVSTGLDYLKSKHRIKSLNYHRHPFILEPLPSNATEESIRQSTSKNTEPSRKSRLGPGLCGNMSHMSLEIVTTPTADTPGTAVLLRGPSRAYVFGSLCEGTQRALTQQGVRLLKAQDCFLTGKAEWQNVGGLVGIILSLADSNANSYNSSMDAYLTKGRAELPTKPRLSLYGPPNLKHLLGTCRRFIFRNGMPIIVTEYTGHSPRPGEHGDIPSTWEDALIDVWALPIAPANQERDAQAEATLEAQRRHFDQNLNTFAEHQIPRNETAEEREQRYDRMRSATLKFMFDSDWKFDKLVERHISEVEMPTAMFIRDPHSKGFVPYNGPRPGGSDPLPDIKVWTRTAWPGAQVVALPPTRPAPDCISYIVRTKPTRGTFDVERAKQLGVKPGRDYGKLTRGESVQNENGEWITPDQVVGSNRPGQGFAILDVPSIGYLETLVNRGEFESPAVMSGIRVFIWMLGPDVVGHPLLECFIKKWDGVRHIVSSMHTNPNRISNDSAASQATLLGIVDPHRYSTPVFDNNTIPQAGVYTLGSSGTSALPKNVMVADRGMSFLFSPKFVMKAETASPLFDPKAASDEISPEVLSLAAQAQEAVRSSRSDLHTWRQLIARPDTEITTLGTGSAAPSMYRNVSATLMRVPGVGNYLFDAGENTLGQLSRVFPLEELTDILKNLRVIWISHLHADHHLGTLSLIRAWYQLVHGGVPNPKPLAATKALDRNAYGLSVISHSGMLQFLLEYSAIEDFGGSRILPIQISANERGYRSELSVLTSLETKGHASETAFLPLRQPEYERLFGFSDIQAVKVSHCYGAMACSMTFPRSSSDPENVKPLKVSYSGDCRPSQAFASIGADSTVLIHEATFDDEMQHDAKAKKHSTTSEAIGIGSQMEAKAVVLTHFSQRYQTMPVLQTIDDRREDPALDVTKTAMEPAADEENTVDTATKIAPSLARQPSFRSENQRVIKIRNKDLKVAISFDYMRVKIGDIAELENFNPALNELFMEESEEKKPDADALINANGKKISEDEGIGKIQKKKKKSGLQRNY